MRVEAETSKFARQRGSSRALGTRRLYVLWNCYAADSHAATPACSPFFRELPFSIAQVFKSILPVLRPIA